MRQHCEICGNAEGNRPHRVREMMFGYRDAFTYLECAACGCLQNAEVPADLGRYYGDGYYSIATRARKVNPVYRAIKSLRTRAYLDGGGGWVGQALLDRFGPPGIPAWVRRAGARQDSAILEIGCGSGAALLDMKSEGFSRLTGADPYIAADIDHGPALKIFKADAFGVRGQYDHVVLEHAFEHIPSQRQTLEALANLLAPGGTLVISMPLVGEAWRRYGVDWFQIDAPRHLFVHSEASFRLLVKGLLQVRDVVYDSGAAQFWASEQYAQDIALTEERSYRMNPERSLFTPDAISRYASQAEDLNRQGQGDQATFYLER